MSCTESGVDTRLLRVACVMAGTSVSPPPHHIIRIETGRFPMTIAMLYRVSGFIFGLAMVLIAVTAFQPPVGAEYIILNPQ